MSVRSSDCVVLVPSCDAYGDLWPVFLHGFHKHWRDCPFRLIIGTNERTDAGAGAETLQSDGGLVWSDRLIDYLNAVSSEYVILMLEDFVLRRDVRASDVDRAMATMVAEKLDCLRLIPRPPPATRRVGGKWFEEIRAQEIYRISTQTAVWRREFLLSILRRGESIWDFEMTAPSRLPATSRIWGSYERVIPYEGIFVHHVLEKGKWIPYERWWLRMIGYPVSQSTRPNMDLVHVGCYHLGEVITRVTQRLNPLGGSDWRAGLRRAAPRFALEWYDRNRHVRQPVPGRRP